LFFFLNNTFKLFWRRRDGWFGCIWPLIVGMDEERLICLSLCALLAWPLGQLTAAPQQGKVPQAESLSKLSLP
jgi:hypothetical protein